jgi:hypothetical protein
VRRTNKIRDIGNSEFEVKPPVLWELDSLTGRVLLERSKKAKKIFICGDSENETNHYKQLVASKVITPPPMVTNGLQQLFFDFFAIGRAQHVITSQRYSSFSMTSALIHGRSLTVAFARNSLQKKRPCIFGACNAILSEL